MKREVSQSHDELADKEDLACCKHIIEGEEDSRDAAAAKEDDEEAKLTLPLENDLLINPKLLQEEEKIHEKNLAQLKRLEAAEAEDTVPELTAEERYSKLLDLLTRSKFYSQYLMDKIQKEDDATKELKAQKLKERRSLTNDNNKKTVQMPAKVKQRTFDGQDIPEEQPLLLSGGIMRDYQVKGYTWMATLYENGINGILADEMGLGKTIQTIALFCHLVEMGVSGPFLIVAPLSTVANWVKEFNKFAPLMPVVLYHGSAKEREALRRTKLKQVHKIKDVFNDARSARNVFVTSYEIGINDRIHFRKVTWRYVVVDEGHRLKNTNCRLIKELRMYPSSNKLLLTGTPLQNNLDELWSLLNFLMPEVFDDLRVFKSWFNPKDMDVEGDDETERIVKQERQGNILSTLHQILTPFLLRRVKADVDLKIPPKKELLVYCPMTDRQRKMYEATVNKTISQMVGQDGQEGEVKDVDVVVDVNAPRAMRNSRFDYGAFFKNQNDDDDIEQYVEILKNMKDRKDAGSMNSAYAAKRTTSDVRVSLKSRMMDLRKCTNHPYLIEYPLTEDGMFYKADENLIDICGKAKVLDQMLSELLRRKHKVLIFSQMTRMLDILADYLHLRGHKFSRLDGSMHFTDRQDNIDQFNEREDINIFLLSTRAGGLGINLTAADTCIIYDSDWNPQQDLQAQDRCHRIGQTKPVMVYRLVTANTIDEKIVERAAAKRRLEKLIIHHKKFKSQDKEGLTKTMEAISPGELLDLLKSTDHAGVVDRKDGPVFTQEQLDALLDRSGLTWAKLNQEKENKPEEKQENNKRKRTSADFQEEPPAKKTTEDMGLFKVIDTEGLPDSGLQSVGNKEQE